MRKHVSSVFQVLILGLVVTLLWDVKGKIDRAISMETMTIQQETESQCLITRYHSEVCNAEVVTTTCRGPNETFAQLKARHQARVAEAMGECPKGD
jgi:anthranilate/para-aminobenzoate synthase component II